MLHCTVTERPTRADTRRQHLLETARALFLANGFHQTGMAQIAAASGIGVGQIYRDFEGKEAIIAAIAQADVTAWLEEDVLAAAVVANDLDALRAWIQRFGGCDVPADKCRMMCEVVAEAGHNERIADLHEAIDRRVRTSLRAALAALTGGADESADVDRLVAFILCIGTGIKTRRIIDPEIASESLTSFVGNVIDKELRALTARSSGLRARQQA